MKKLTAILAAFILLFSASAFTKKDDTVSARIKTEFEKNFTSAKYVSWQKIEGVYFATFKIEAQNFSAAFNDDGELLGVQRTILLSQLPLNVSLTLQNKYSAYSISPAVLELSHDGQTTYYIEAENAKYKLKLSSNSSGTLNVEKKTKKK